MTSSTPRDDTNAELRERAEVLYEWYPDKHVPMDTLEFTAKAHGLTRDLLSALDAAEGRVREAREVARCEYPRATNGFSPWIDCGKCVGCQCKAALSAQHPKAGAQEDEGESGGGA